MIQVFTTCKVSVLLVLMNTLEHTYIIANLVLCLSNLRLRSWEFFLLIFFILLVFVCIIAEDAARDTLEHVIDEALSLAHLSQVAVRAICLAVSGVNHPKDQEKVLNWMRYVVCTSCGNLKLYFTSKATILYFYWSSPLIIEGHLCAFIGHLCFASHEIVISQWWTIFFISISLIPLWTLCIYIT